MKELSIEEKAQRYDEALERARKCLDEKRDTCFVRPDVIFPELAESEDEKIKQRIIKLIKMSSEVGGFALHKWEADEMLAWLEKQGKQKVSTVDWRPSDEQMITLRHVISGCSYDIEPLVELETKLKEMCVKILNLKIGNNESKNRLGEICTLLNGKVL